MGLKSIQNHRLTVLASLFVLALTGCQTTGMGGSGVSYGDAKAVETVNTDLGSTDVHMISETMTQHLHQQEP